MGGERARDSLGGDFPSCLPSLGLMDFLSPPDGGSGPGKAPWPGDFGTTAKESSGNGASEERPWENGDALPREGSLGPLPGPSAQPHKGEWGMTGCHAPPASNLTFVLWLVGLSRAAP